MVVDGSGPRGTNWRFCLVVAAAALLLLGVDSVDASPVSVTTDCGVTLTPGDDVATIIGTGTPGAAYCFAPGTYRINHPIQPLDGQSLVGAPGVVITGARPVRNWTHSGTVWIATKQNQAPVVNTLLVGQVLANPASLYLENLYMDGGWLKKVGVKLGGVVIGKGPAAVKAGMYFMNYDTHRLILGSNPTGHDLETNTLLGGDAITSSGVGVTISDLDVEMARANGITAQGTGWVISNVQSRMNGMRGALVLDGGRVIGSHLDWNGEYGVTAQGADIQVSGTDISYNNAARMEGKGVCFAAGGSKFVQTSGLVVEGNTFHDNYCNAIWLDINNTGSLVEDNVVDGNLGHGIVQEIGYDATITGNTVTDNTGNGILVRSSAGTIIAANTALRNRAGGVYLVQVQRDDSPSDLGVHETTGTQVSLNMISLNGRSTERVGGVTLHGTEVFTPDGSNQFFANTWYLPQALTGSFYWNGTRTNEVGWQTLGQDVDGTFAIGQP